MLNRFRNNEDGVSWIGDKPHSNLIRGVSFKNATEATLLSFEVLEGYLDHYKSDLFKREEDTIYFQEKQLVRAISDTEMELFSDNLLAEVWQLSVIKRGILQRHFMGSAKEGHIRLTQADMRRTDALIMGAESLIITHTHTLADLLIFTSLGVKIVAHGLSDPDLKFREFFSKRYRIPVTIEALTPSGVCYCQNG